MDGSKLSLFMVFVVSAVAARLIPNGDVDKKHNSDDQELLDRQDYSPRRRFPKPAILTTGICVKSPSLPCCKQTIEVYEMLKKPGEIMDLSYPNCRSEGYYAGYYASKQCNWFMCYCVDPNGNSVEVTTQAPKYAWYNNYFDINCKDYAVEKPDLGNYEYEVEPAEKLLTSKEISNLPDLPVKEDPETAGMTIVKTGPHRAAHGCVQWGEPCTVGETNCCGDSNYDGTCEWRIGTLFKYACGVKSGFPFKLD